MKVPNIWLILAFLKKLLNLTYLWTWFSITQQLDPFYQGWKGKVFLLQAKVGPWGSGRLRPWIFSTFGTMKVVRSLPLCTGRLHPREFSWYSFLEAESTPGHMVPLVASEEIPSDTTGDRSRDPPTSSAVFYKRTRLIFELGISLTCYRILSIKVWY
jgi:hypothetical protein